MDRRWLAAPLLLLVLAGCSTAEPGQAHPAGGGLPDAADGRDYAACADGTCEVLVTGPVAIPTGGRGDVATLSITKVGAGGVDYEITGASGGTGSGSLSTGCIFTLYENGSGSLCSSGTPRAPEPTDGVLAVQLVGSSAAGVVLRLVSGAPGPPPESLVPHIPGFGG